MQNTKCRARAALVGVVLAAAAALMVSVLAGCKAREGSSCEGAVEVCADARTALRCNASGKYEAINCNGTIGCLKLGAAITCDMKDTVEAAGCIKSQEADLVCEKGNASALECRNGTFARDQECRGLKGCSMNGKVLTCDNSKAEQGDICHTPNSHACAVDSKSMFICRNGHFELTRRCRGKDGCSVKTYSSEALCDSTISEPGDPCGAANAVACSADGARELICRGGRYEISRECSRQPCTVVGARRIECN
jgi:hypothetical protein